MARILVTPEEVDQASQRFQQASTQSREMTNQLNSLIQGMSGNWDGMTKNRFYQEFQQAKATMDQFAEMLQNISQELKAIAERFRAADQQ